MANIRQLSCQFSSVLWLALQDCIGSWHWIITQQ